MKKNFRLRKESMLVIGLFSLMIANTLSRFGGNIFLINFFEGMFTGISLVMNLSFLIRFGVERRQNNQV